MKHVSAKVLFVSVSLLVIGWACGPFFPDTVLNRPQAALEVPPVSYLSELYDVAGKEQTESDESKRSDGATFLDQIPLELAELRGVWTGEGVGEDEIENRSAKYEALRLKLLKPIVDAGRMDFSVDASFAVSELPERPLAEGFPEVVADYVEGARLLAIGKSADARQVWKTILEKPVEVRKLRSLWAAWMLAKTSANQDECAEWYGRVEDEAELGGTDVLNLRAGAKSWLAAMEKDHLIALRLYYDAFVGGKQDAAIDIRRVTGFIVSSKDHDFLGKAAADPLVRRLVNLDLHAMLDGALTIESGLNEMASQDSPWMAALRALGDGPIKDAARIGWVHYAAGNYADSEKWLALAEPSEPLALWLRAKFDLRRGDLEGASTHLSEAIKLETARGGWNPGNPTRDMGLWFAGAEERQAQRQGRMLADAGIVALAREEYVSALDLLRGGGYWEDAAYLAERVITLDGLLRHVRNVAPEWQPMPGEQQQEKRPLVPGGSLTSQGWYYNYGENVDNKLRYLLARRLARVGRFKESAEFMPARLVPLLWNYAAIDKARRSGKFSGEALAAITWRQALIHRHRGAELFSTEGAPDGAAYGWSFPMPNLGSARSFTKGWTRDFENFWEFKESEEKMDTPIPAISTDETERWSKTKLRHDVRFHYRFKAAELAWEASQQLPANHALLAALYNTAGRWIAISDPVEADRFYQALVRRCAKTNEGRAADERRWFLPDLQPLGDMPLLPDDLKHASGPY